MKKRYVPIITVTLAILLVGSVAYAADKRKKTRPVVPEPNEMSEESLRIELLAAEDQHEKSPGTKTASLMKTVDDMTAAKVKAKKSGNF